MSSNNIYTPTPCKILAQTYWGYEPPSSDEIAEGSSATYLHGWHGEKNGMYGKKQSEYQKAAAAKAASKTFKGVPKWYKTYTPIMHGSDNPRSQPCIINEIRYNTVTEASIALGIHRTTLSHRCKSPNKKFTEYYYI